MGGLFRKILAGCFITDPTLAPCYWLCRTSRPLFLSFHFLTASNPLLIKTTVCYLLYVVHLNFRTAQRVVIGILILYYLRKLILREVK